MIFSNISEACSLVTTVKMPTLVSIIHAITISDLHWFQRYPRIVWFLFQWRKFSVMIGRIPIVFFLNFLLCPLFEYILRIHNYNFAIFTRACQDVYFLHLFFDFQIHRLSMACTLLLTLVGVIVIFYFRHWGFKVCECFNMLWFFSDLQCYFSPTWYEVCFMSRSYSDRLLNFYDWYQHWF